MQLELFRLKEVQVHASHKIQRMNVGQPRPQPEGILAREVCTAAISEIDMQVEGEEGNALYLARWDDFGYVTIEQLRAMVLVIDARVAMTKVEAALKWIDMVTICSSAEEPPFNDCASYPKVNCVPNCLYGMKLYFWYRIFLDIMFVGSDQGLCREYGAQHIYNCW